MTTKPNSKPPAAAKSGAAKNASPKGKGRWKPGESGNRKGRPEGSRNWASRIAEQMVEGDAETIIGGLIEKAKSGHFGAQKFLAERLLPPKRSRPLSIALRAIETPGDIVEAIDQIWSALGMGMITPDESEHFIRLLETKRKALATLELAAEVASMKEQMEVAKCRRID